MNPARTYIKTVIVTALAAALIVLLSGARSGRTPRQGTLSTSTYEYSGGVTDGRMNGFGVCRYANGNVYTGYWDMDYKHGLGRMEYADGTMEFGRWRRGVRPECRGRRFKPGERVIGIDVSKYQGNIDWSKLAIPANAAGKVSRSGSFLQPVLFIIAKSTQGTSIRNSFFTGQFGGAKEHGIVRGAYHFLSPSSSGTEQARYFIRHTPLEAGDLPPVLDLEVKQSVMRKQHAKILRIARQWLDAVEQHYGVKPIIYTYDNYYRDYLHGHGFDDYDFWIANYNGGPRHAECLFWQFTETGKVLGINHATDINVFEGGDYADFKDYLRRKGIQ